MNTAASIRVNGSRDRYRWFKVTYRNGETRRLFDTEADIRPQARWYEPTLGKIVRVEPAV